MIINNNNNNDNVFHYCATKQYYNLLNYFVESIDNN
jgi:hypothetical protein